MIKKVSNLLELKKVREWVATKKDQCIGLDTETNGLDPLINKVLLLQIGDEHTQFVLDVARLDVPGRNPIKDILEDINYFDIKCVIHNAQFDYKMIKTNFNIELKNMICTHIAARLLVMGLATQISTSLDYSLERYLGVKVDKGERLTFIDVPYGSPITDEQIVYAGTDVRYLLPLKDKLLNKLNQESLEEVAVLEFNTIKVTGDMELNGALIDTKIWRDLEEVAISESKVIKSKLDSFFLPIVQNTNLFGEVVINYNSQAQMKEYLSKIIGKELPSTDKKILSKINHPAVQTLLEYRKQMKLISTYGVEFLRANLKDDGRIHSSFNQLGADTGRYASSNPNLQNIPRKGQYRRPFIAPKGYKFISADFSGQELRLLAHLSQEPELIKALKEQKDLHAYSASLLYKLPYDDFFEYEDTARTIIKVDKKGDPIFEAKMKILRDNTKKTTFGILYGMGPSKLADELGITKEEAIKLIRMYFDTFPKVEQLMIKLANDAIKNKYALSPLDGRKLFFYDLDWNHVGKVAHAQRQAQNLPFQGAGASTTKLALVNIDAKIKEKGYTAEILFAVHDEINLICIDDQADECTKMVEDEMISAFNKYAPSVVMEVKPAIGDYWIH